MATSESNLELTDAILPLVPLVFDVEMANSQANSDTMLPLVYSFKTL